MAGKELDFANVTWILVQPDYGRNHRHYPINRLRNLAIKSVRTSHMLCIDTDFVASPDLYERERARLELWHRRKPLTPVSSRRGFYPSMTGEERRALIQDMSESVSEDWASKWNGDILSAEEDDSDDRVAFVVPCFALRLSYQGDYPKTMDDVNSLFEQDQAYITDSVVGHRITGFEIFSRPLVFPGSNDVTDPDAVYSSKAYYHVCFENQWEPYYIVATYHSPMYDERFRNQGGDKQSHALFLNACNYRFLVLRHAFLFHLDHTLDMIWPGDSFQKGGIVELSLFSNFYKTFFIASAAGGGSCSSNGPVDFERDHGQVMKHRMKLGRKGQIDFFADYIGWLNGRPRKARFLFDYDVRISGSKCADPLYSVTRNNLF